MSIRAVISGEGFKKLVAGEAIKVSAYNKETQANIEIELILSDIGFTAMASALRQAELQQYNSGRWLDDFSPREDDEPEAANKSTRELLADYARVLNEHGPDSQEAKEFLEQHIFDSDFQELAGVATTLKRALLGDVNNSE